MRGYEGEYYESIEGEYYESIESEYFAPGDEYIESLLAQSIEEKHNSADVTRDFFLQDEPAARTRPVVVAKPPGAQLMRVARFFFSREAIDEVFVPTYNDFWHEYAEAKVKGESWKARWIRLRYYWAFAKTSGLLKAFEWAWDRVKGILEKIPI